MMIDLATGVAYTIFWFAVIMIVVFGLMRVIKWLEGSKDNS